VIQHQVQRVPQISLSQQTDHIYPLPIFQAHQGRRRRSFSYYRSAAGYLKIFSAAAAMTQTVEAICFLDNAMDVTAGGGG
jgi:hypothetical protein